jgi:glycerol kinase
VTNKHIVRATLESIAYQSRDIVEVMQKDAGILITELRVDGGVSANNFLMQFQSDILGVNVSRPTNPETTALGAAYLAALKAGITDISKIHEIRKTETLFRPQINSEITDELYSGWKEAVKRVRGWKVNHN